MNLINQLKQKARAMLNVWWAGINIKRGKFMSLCQPRRKNALLWIWVTWVRLYVSMWVSVCYHTEGTQCEPSVVLSQTHTHTALMTSCTSDYYGVFPSLKLIQVWNIIALWKMNSPVLLIWQCCGAQFHCLWCTSLLSVSWICTCFQLVTSQHYNNTLNVHLLMLFSVIETSYAILEWHKQNSAGKVTLVQWDLTLQPQLCNLHSSKPLVF